MKRQGNRTHFNDFITPAPQGPPTGGSVYIRWGSTTCPNIPGTEIVYQGIAAGSLSSQQGGGSQYLCLPKIPMYANFQLGVQGFSPLHGVEYMPFGGPLNKKVQYHNVPCAVCCTNRSKLLMIPAIYKCPKNWTREYWGYLMTESFGNYRNSFECVDYKPQVIPWTGNFTDGAHFYHIEATCNGIPCPHYDRQKELTCAVCTK